MTVSTNTALEFEIDSSSEKILYISLTNGAGGAEQILLMSARVTRGDLLFLKQVRTSGLLVNDTDPPIRYLNSRSIFMGFIVLLKELLKYRKDYIIISSHPYLNAYLGILKRVGFLRSKLVTRECTSVFLRFKGFKRLSYKILYTLGYPAIDLFICQTNEMKAQLLNNLSFLTDQKVKVFHNPVDQRLLKLNSMARVDDPILDEKFICSAGRLIPLKGYDILIKAFEAIAAKHTDIKLLILGEGPERERLEELVKSLQLDGKVILKGFVSNPFPYFKQAAICVVSSIQEGFPNVLLQMMTLNESVVSTLCADGIDAFKSVVQVKPNDIMSLSKALEERLTFNKTEKNENLQYISDRSPENFSRLILSNVK